MESGTKPVTVEEALRALVETLVVNVRTDGIFENNTKVALWYTNGLDNSVASLGVAGNYYDEAHLNQVWLLLNQARRVLGLPEMPPLPEGTAFLARVIKKEAE